MDYTRSKGTSEEDLLSMSGVRGLLCAIFVSDIVTADGKHLENVAAARTTSREHTSKYFFPKEAPTTDD